MDALDLLISDHNRVKGLFEQFRTTNGKQGQKTIFENIRSELEAHAQMEETVFYPTFRKFDDFDDILEESLKEHQKMKNLLEECQQAVAGDGFQSKVEELISAVEHHVQEEEGEFFTKVRNVMKRTEREQLGRHMQAAKDEILAA
jgi:hemerythrin superfamily protein